MTKHDLLEEGLITLAEAAKLLPKRRAGKATHVATLFRWAISGVKGIKLETLQVGGCKCTSKAALSRFFESLSRGEKGPPAPRTSARKARDIARAEESLAKAGI